MTDYKEQLAAVGTHTMQAVNGLLLDLSDAQFENWVEYMRLERDTQKKRLELNEKFKALAANAPFALPPDEDGGSK